MSNELQDCVLRLIDVKIKAGVKDIKKIKGFSDNLYLSDESEINEKNDRNLNSFDLKKGEVKDFILVIWLSNLDVEQDEEDASGSFSASITYQALDGSKLSANIYQG